MTRRVCAALAALAVATGPVAAETTLSRAVPLVRDPDSVVTIVCPAGDVTVRSGEADEVRVQARLYDETLRLELSTGPGRKTALVDLRGEARPTPVPAVLEVSIPVWAALRVHASTGSVTVVGGDPAQRLDIVSRDGDIRVSGTAQTLAAGTFTGSIIVDGTYGEITARTATGPITLTGSAATASTSTLSGLTMTFLTGLYQATFDSVSGDLVLRVAFRESEGASNLRAETSQGSIQIWVPPDLAPAYHLSTDRPVSWASGDVAAPKGAATMSWTPENRDGVWITTATYVHDLGSSEARGFLSLSAPRGTITIDTWRPE